MMANLLSDLVVVAAHIASAHCQGTTPLSRLPHPAPLPIGRRVHGSLAGDDNVLRPTRPDADEASVGKPLEPIVEAYADASGQDSSADECERPKTQRPAFFRDEASRVQ